MYSMRAESQGGGGGGGGEGEGEEGGGEKVELHPFVHMLNCLESLNTRQASPDLLPWRVRPFLGSSPDQSVPSHRGRQSLVAARVLASRLSAWRSYCRWGAPGS